MTNKLEFVEGDTITNRIEDLVRPRNFARGYSANHGEDAWFWCEATDDGTYIYLRVYSAVSKTSAHFLEQTRTITMTNVDINGGTINDVILRAWDENIYCAVNMRWYDTTQTQYYITTLGLHTVDGGAAGWVNDDYVGGFSATSAEWMYLVDLLQYSVTTDTYLLSTINQSTKYVRMYKPLVGGGNATLSDSDTMIDFAGIYSGSWIEGTDQYQFVYKDNSAVWRTCYFDVSADAFTDGSSITLTEPTTLNPVVQQYAIQSGFELLMDKKYMRTRLPDETTFSKYTAASETSAILIIWSEDFTRIEYIIWDDKIWIWTKGGSIEKIQEYTGNTTVGQIDWFCDGSESWDESYVYLPITRGDITHRVMNYPISQIQSSTQPFSNQWIQLYNDSDELIHKCRILKDKNDGSNYVYTTISGIEEDFKRKITESYTTKTIHYIIKDIIDKYFNHIWYDAGISTTNATTFTKSFRGQGFKEVLKWAAQYAGFIGRFTPDYEMYLGAFAASGETVADNSSGYGYNERSFETFHEKFSLIRLYGGYVSGVQLESVKIGEPNQGYWQDTFANITVQAELDAMALQIKTDKNVEITLAVFNVAGKDQLNVGESFTYTSVKRTITAETWYFIKNVIDLKNGMQVITASDSFWMPHPTKDEARENKISQNEQNIGAVETEVKDTVALEAALTATATEINTVADGILATAAEINYACDGIDTHVAFRATQSTGQGTSSTFQQMTFNVEDYDEGGNFSSNQFTAPYTGIYHFDAGILFNSGAWGTGHLGYLVLYVNGVEKVNLGRFQCAYPRTMYIRLIGSTDLRLTIGQTVRVYFKETSGATSLYAAPNYNFFNGHLVRKT